VRCAAYQRKELQRLCRYITPPAIANRSVSELAVTPVSRYLASTNVSNLANRETRAVGAIRPGG